MGSRTFDRFFLERDQAFRDRLALKRLRRRIRANRQLGSNERAELLEIARDVPGCIPRLMVLDENGRLVPG